ncbi:DUF1194 domain-containing protein [Thalassotalea sp. LPB0316]|uniref:DUF1194 domain-containing protein n=1 Tax=Thalassotalea sp. LPB0316 TaxID=2769490 RepID=UPI0018684244|nr:DUF1194 domain-containing protein [Thalassotalea sp. LPB0316]QOL25430.1 DUF1194 domain-containing protein [Thalassotalea sp. LPB0316]
MKLLISSSILGAILLLSSKAIAITPVDIELSLLVDISGSISASEYDMQMQGYQAAFESERLQNAIINGTEGQIAVQLIMWSGSNQQQIMIDWSLIDSAESANNFAQLVGDLARPFSGWTAIGSAIDFASPLFATNDYHGYQQIIDISGDGTNNAGLSVAQASDQAIADGVDTINGIVITEDQNVIDQYANQVINGDSPFLLATTDFSGFQQAIENKIVAEIEGSRPVGAISVPAPGTNILFAISLICIFGSRVLAKENTHETV